MRRDFILLLIFLPAINYGQTIKGKILDTDTKKPLKGANVYLVKPDYSIKDDDTTTIGLTDIIWRPCSHPYYWILSRTTSDKNGNYKFESLITGNYSVIASFKMPVIKDIGHSSRMEIDSNINIGSGTVYNNKINLMVTCPYNKTKKQSFCPICKRKDKVLPMIFGLMRYKEDGTTDYGIHGKDYYNPGCESDLYCNPTKRCMRCEKDF